MAKRFPIGTFTEDGSLSIDLEKNEISGNSFGLLLNGTIDGGDVTVTAGTDDTDDGILHIMKPSDASWIAGGLAALTAAGLFPLVITARFIKFTMANAGGSTDLDVTLFVKPRGA